MSVFAILMLVLLMGFLVLVLLLGAFSTRSNADMLDWKPTRTPEVEAENEVEEVHALLASVNRRRLKKGLGPLSEADYELQVAYEERAMSEHLDRMREEFEPPLDDWEQRRKARALRREARLLRKPEDPASRLLRKPEDPA